MIVKAIVGIIVGGLLGFMYYKKVGCPTGSCPITSNPYSSTIYGVVIGLLVSSSF